MTVHARTSPWSASSSTDLAPGTTVGDYVIEERLGHGGMGTVYRAIHPVIDKQIAIKVLHHELCANSEAVNRFVQEARAVNRIGHPNIVDVFGFGTTEDHRAFLAMALLTGESLGRRLERSPSLTSHEAAHILLEVSYALEAAHAAGIVHRDLKPDNVFLVVTRKAECEVRLLDFGIAKLTNDGAMLEGPVTSTQPGMIIGTPQYMAPEQARGQVLDGSTDIYALGVMAFEMFAGRPPFTSDDPVELVAKHITLLPPAPSDFNAELPELVDQLVAAMLRKDPGLRPTITVVQSMLEQIQLAPLSDHALDRKHKRQLQTEVLVDLGIAPKPNLSRRRWWLIPAVLATIAVAAKLLTIAVDSSDAPVIATPTPAKQVPVITPITEAPSSSIPPAPPPVEHKPPSNDATKPRLRRPAHKPKATIRVEPTTVPTTSSEPTPDSSSVPVKHASPEDDDALRSPYEKP